MSAPGPSASSSTTPADGVRRSIEESLERLGLDRIDIALIHDPDDHWQAALDGAYPALARLREQGVIRAVGAGMNQSEMLARFVRETDMDAVLLAGRYTLLEQGALDELLPACEQRGVAVLIGGVMNSGLLADPRAGSRFNYTPAPAEIVERARQDRRGLRPARRPAPGRRHPVPARPPRRRLARGRRPNRRPPRRVPGLRPGRYPGSPVGRPPRRGPAPVGRPDAARDERLIVDAHHHFWDPAAADYPWLTDELASIRRAFGPADLEPALRANGVDATVLVQTRSSLEETEDFLALADRTPFVRGVVGWVDLADPGVADTIAALRGRPDGAHLVGIRHQAHDEPDPDWLVRDDVIRGIEAVGRAGLVYDLLVRSRELPAALALARRLPDVPFVIDHIAKPPIASGELEPWASRIAPFRELEHVACKVSGMVTEADWSTWTPADLQPYVDHVLEVFGPDRLLFGSDWPVCLLAASYDQVLDAARATLANLGDDDRAKVLGGTAARVYRL